MELSLVNTSEVESSFISFPAVSTLQWCVHSCWDLEMLVSTLRYVLDVYVLYVFIADI